MGSELEFEGTLASVCEYLEINGVFDEKVGALLNKIKVTNLECDSRRVTKGTIFYAKKGQHYNPFDHLDEIKAKGAVAILIDAPDLIDNFSNGTLPSMNFSASYGAGGNYRMGYGEPRGKSAPSAAPSAASSAAPSTGKGAPSGVSGASGDVAASSSAASAQSGDESMQFQNPITMGSRLATMMDSKAKQRADDSSEGMQDDVVGASFATENSSDTEQRSYDGTSGGMWGDNPELSSMEQEACRQNLLNVLRSPIQGALEEDRDQLRRSGRKVILQEVSSPSYAEKSYHATSNTPEANAIAEANLLRLVLPSNRSLSALAGFIYGNPSHKLKLIGVTGTNGKSTITNLVAQMLNLSGHRCAIFGTLGYGFLDNMQKSANTTLDAISLQRELAHYVKLGADYAVLEVSSIGFCENRVSGLRFYAGGFSNLSQDHLDYHKTMEDYFHAKLSFLRMIPTERLVINRNRETGQRLAEMIPNSFEVGVENPYFEKRTNHNFLNIKKINFKHSSLELFLNNGEKGVTRTELNLMGYFNAENYAVALGIMLALGFEYKHMASLAPKLKPITGRMECFVADYKPRMIVDYAHTPDGVEQALKAAQAHLQDRGRVFAIVGCGGDRDRRKRPIMAMKASIFADYAIFTADNPRSENVLDIIDDMMLGIIPLPSTVKLYKGLAKLLDYEATLDEKQTEDLDNLKAQLSQRMVEINKELGGELVLNWHRNSLDEYVKQPLPDLKSLLKNVVIIPDREQAIRYAFAKATAQDCIVVCGKGHEDYQIFKDKTIHFSDREICCKLLDISLPEAQNSLTVAEESKTTLPSASNVAVASTKTKSTKASAQATQAKASKAKTSEVKAPAKAQAKATTKDPKAKDSKTKAPGEDQVTKTKSSATKTKSAATSTTKAKTKSVVAAKTATKSAAPKRVAKAAQAKAESTKPKAEIQATKETKATQAKAKAKASKAKAQKSTKTITQA